MNFYKEALDHLADGVLISDPKGKVIYINEAYEQITGLSRKDMLEHNLLDLLDDHIISQAISLEAIQSGQPVSTIHRYVTGKSALSTATPVFDSQGEVICVINSTRSVKELMDLQEELNKTRERVQEEKEQLHCLRRLLNTNKELIFRSEAMSRTVESAKRVAPYDSTVLIFGESGTGKEIIAKFIHNHSSRSEEAFIRVNCAAIPKELFESELFGYEKGAFTGASSAGKRGFFELAQKGTLLLDEIGELPLHIQPKLLRAIQEKEILRVGAEKPIRIDTRIITCTNKDLEEEVRQGRFREDLMFRLRVVPIHIRPLRERIEDIPLLISFFFERLNRKYKTTKSIDSEVIELFLRYRWPGNVRELENIIEYLYIMSGDILTPEIIPGKMLSQITLDSEGKDKNGGWKNLTDLMELYEKTIIQDVSMRYNSLIPAAESLGIHPSTLCRKMKKYGLHFIEESFSDNAG